MGICGGYKCGAPWLAIAGEILLFYLGKKYCYPKNEGKIMEEKGLFLALQVAIMYPINTVLNLILAVIMYPVAVFFALLSPGSAQ